MNLRGYQGLTVWNRSVDVVELTYRLSETLSHGAARDLLTDMRRASLAIPTHLASGYQTRKTADYLRHVHAAQLALGQLESQLTIVERLGWAAEEETSDLQSLLTHMHHLLGCLERYLTGQSAELEAPSR